MFLVSQDVSNMKPADEQKSSKACSKFNPKGPRPLNPRPRLSIGSNLADVRCMALLSAHLRSENKNDARAGVECVEHHT